MSDNLLRYLPSNLQVLAQRQHEELESLRARVPALDGQITALQGDGEYLEALRHALSARVTELERQGRQLALERQRAILMLAHVVRAGSPAFVLAGIASGLLAVFALRLWGW